MSEAVISIHQIKRSRVKFYQPAAFQFRDDRPAHWLQHLCLWTLKKLACFYLDEKDTVKRIEIDQKRILELARKQINMLLSYDKKPRQIYMGPDEFYDGKNQEYEMYQFNVRGAYSKDGGNFLLDLPVKVLPYMKGVLVVP